MRPSTSDKKAVICVLGDETGVVNAYFPFSVFLQVGKIISLFNVDALVVEEHIQVTLNSHSRL